LRIEKGSEGLSDVTAPTGFQYFKILICHWMYAAFRSWSVAEIGMSGTVAELRARGYKEGSIVRVQLHNFISYDDAVVYPGPKLNIILGPNGGVKSLFGPHVT
jgi:hypothetical protein